MKKFFSGVIVSIILSSFLEASSVSYQTNAMLEKGAVVCKSERSLFYLLKSKKNYQNVLEGLKSNNFYKNCFLSTKNIAVLVAAHYSSKKLIKNYYVINKHINQTRYVPIEFIEPLKSAQKTRHKYTKKRKKKQIKKSKYRQTKAKKARTVKRYAKKEKSKKVVYRVKKIPTNVKQHSVLNQEKQNIVETAVHTLTRTSIKDEQTQEKQLKGVLSRYSEAKKKISTSANTNTSKSLDYMRVFRCTAVSFDESFRGEHTDREESKKIALENCKKYQKNESICIIENCFILRIDLH